MLLIQHVKPIPVRTLTPPNGKWRAGTETGFWLSSPGGI